MIDIQGFILVNVSKTILHKETLIILAVTCHAVSAITKCNLVHTNATTWTLNKYNFLSSVNP